LKSKSYSCNSKSGSAFWKKPVKAINLKGIWMVCMKLNGDKLLARELTMALGRVVQGRRQKLGLSQEKLASKASLHRTYITDVERGSRNLSLNTVVRIASALNVRASFLLQQAERELNIEAAEANDNF
jgi:ribosome-binding protein aMBF1 (putative translation factor)